MRAIDVGQFQEMVEPSMSSALSVRLATTAEEIEAAKRLRYEAFFSELDVEPPQEIGNSGQDEDPYDKCAEHLIVVDENSDKLAVVGNYRLIRAPNFYSSQRYDLARLLDKPERLLEVGRSCVHRRHRTGPVMQLLWRGLADYILRYKIEILFGCASFEGAYVGERREHLAYLYHHHLAPAAIRPRARNECIIPMNEAPVGEVDGKRVRAQLPPLIKGYLRLGAFVGDGAVFDIELDELDVCIVLQTERITKRYARHYLGQGRYAA